MNKKDFFSIIEIEKPIVKDDKIPVSRHFYFTPKSYEKFLDGWYDARDKANKQNFYVKIKDNKIHKVLNEKKKFVPVDDDYCFNKYSFDFYLLLNRITSYRFEEELERSCIKNVKSKKKTQSSSKMSGIEKSYWYFATDGVNFCNYYFFKNGQNVFTCGIKKSSNPFENIHSYDNLKNMFITNEKTEHSLKNLVVNPKYIDFLNSFRYENIIGKINQEVIVNNYKKFGLNSGKAEYDFKNMIDYHIKNYNGTKDYRIIVYLKRYLSQYFIMSDEVESNQIILDNSNYLLFCLEQTLL